MFLPRWSWLLLLLSFLQLSFNAIGQGTILRGQVTEGTLSGKPLPGAQVSVPAGANSAYSKTNGFFEMSFNDKKPGQKVRLAVLKDGYEVVNNRELDVILRAEPDELVYIVMAKKADLEEAQKKFIGINLSGIRQEINNQAEKKAKEPAMQRDTVEKLNQKIKETEYFAQFIAEKTSRTDTSLFDREFKKAYVFYKEGKLNQAQGLLPFNILRKAALAFKQQGKLKQQQVVLNKFILKARISFADYHWDSARLCYRFAVEQDTSNYDFLDEYLTFLSSQKDRVEFDSLLKRALMLSPDPWERARMLYHSTLRFNEAENAQQVIDISFEALNALRFYKTDHDRDVNDLRALLIARVGYGYYIARNKDSALKYLKHAVTLLPERYASWYSATILVHCYQSIGVCYSESIRRDSALYYFEQSVEICEELLKKHPEDVDAQELYADCLLDVGLVYLEAFRTEEAVKVLNKRIKIYLKLFSINAAVYTSDLIHSYIRVVDCYAESKNEALADSILQKCQDILKKNKRDHLDLRVLVCSKLAEKSSWHNKFHLVLKYLAEAIRLHELSAPGELEDRDENLALLYSRYARFVLKIHPRDSSYYYHKKAIHFREQCCAMNIPSCIDKRNQINATIYKYFADIQNKDSVIAYQRKIIKNYRLLSHSNYNFDIGIFLNILNDFDAWYTAAKDFIGEVEFLKTTSSLFEERHRRGILDLDSLYFVSLYWIGDVYINIKNLDSAYKYVCLTMPVIDSLLRTSHSYDSMYSESVIRYLHVNMLKRNCQQIKDMDVGLYMNIQRLKDQSGILYKSTLAYHRRYIGLAGFCLKEFAFGETQLIECVTLFDELQRQGKVSKFEYAKSLLDINNLYVRWYEDGREKEVLKRGKTYFSVLTSLIDSTGELLKSQNLASNYAFLKIFYQKDN